MAIIIDTNIAIHLRDGDMDIAGRIVARSEPVSISVVTLTELEGGVANDPSSSHLRRRLLDEMLVDIEILPFTASEVAAYRRILAVAGFDRRRVMDRMIAAQAIVADRPLITRNGGDFRDVPGLRLETW